MTNTAKEQHNWAMFLKLFGEQNLSRRTRISVFEGAPDEMRDYWLEEGLPLLGIDVDTRAPEAPTVEIMLGEANKADSPQMTHIIANARFVKIILSASGSADGLEISDAEGRTTILHFEEKT